METPGEHKSAGDPNWHPRQQPSGEPANTNPQTEPTMDLMAKTELKARIAATFPPERVNELYRQEGLMRSDGGTLDPVAKTELEARIAALYPPERMKKLFKEEGVSKNDSVNTFRSLKRKILDFLKI